MAPVDMNRWEFGSIWCNILRHPRAPVSYKAVKTKRGYGLDPFQTRTGPDSMCGIWLSKKKIIAASAARQCKRRPCYQPLDCLQGCMGRLGASNLVMLALRNEFCSVSQASSVKIDGGNTYHWCSLPIIALSCSAISVVRILLLVLNKPVGGLKSWPLTNELILLRGRGKYLQK